MVSEFTIALRYSRLQQEIINKYLKYEDVVHIELCA